MNGIWDALKDSHNKTTCLKVVFYSPWKINEYLKSKGLTEEDIKEFNLNILNNLDEIDEVQWKTKVHAYYYLEEEKNNDRVIRNLSQHTNEDYAELRNVALRLTSIMKKASDESC